MKHPRLHVRDFGAQEYQIIWQRMQDFTRHRDEHSVDWLWLVEHPPVFTQGRAGKPEHVLAPGNIPIIKTDRGGQVTFHGPGQIVLYVLIDIRRRKLGIKTVVAAIEQAVIKTLADLKIAAELKTGAPGVYVQGRKIASLGLRVTQGCTYHGVSLNFNMDLEPFSRINPCGYQGLEVTQVSELNPQAEQKEIEHKLCDYLAQELGYNDEQVVWPNNVSSNQQPAETSSS